MYEVNDTIAQHEIQNLDMVALHHILDDAPQRIAPISIAGDSTVIFCSNQKADIWKCEFALSMRQ